MIKSIFFSGFLILIISCCLINSQVFGQSEEWYEMMQNPQAQFEETVKAFESWWGDRPVTKGSGYKQFQRWKYYMETRVADDGSQSLPSKTLEEFARYLSSRDPQRARSSFDGNWQGLGPVNLPLNSTGQPNGVGRLTAIAFHPEDDQIVYAGSPAGGFHVSLDYGNTWINSSENLTRLGVSSIVVHPDNPDTIYIGTGDRDGGDAPGYGVWWSLDGGQTWSFRNSGMGNRTVYEILMHPDDPDILIAATQSRIYRSVNGGATWSQTFSGHNCKDIAFKPGDPNYIYATGNKVYRSIDNGQSFNQITSGVPANASRIAIAVSPLMPSWVYLFAGNNSSGFVGFYRSTDSGASFSLRSDSPNICGYDVNGGSGSQAWYDMVAIADPNDPDHVFVGAINVWETFDGGSSWSIVSHWYGAGGNPDVHADQHVMEYSPHTGDLFHGHDGGIHFTTNGGISFTEISSGLDNAQVYKIGQSQTKRNIVINGYQDNGTAVLDNGWRTEIGGDGMECIVDYEDHNVMYGALYYGNIRRSLDRGSSFSNIVGGISEDGAWVTPYKLHPDDPDTMLVGMDNVWRSYNVKSGNPPSWSQISSLAGSGTVRDIAFAPSNPAIVYISRSGNNNFYKCDNMFTASPVWQDLESNLPGGGFPADIEVHPTNSDKLWIALGNNIYQSVNGGLSWTDFSGSLPNISLNTIVFDIMHPNEAMYVGMDVGVYYRDNTMSDWMLFAAGLPNTEILELELYYDEVCRNNDVLRAATYGRGLWESDLKDPENLSPIACFEIVATDVCVDETCMLTDNSAYNPDAWQWTITPSSFEFVNGTSAASRNPQLRFLSPGTYTVSLLASNANGSNLMEKVDYLSVGGNAFSLPYSQNFEAMDLCSTDPDCELTQCILLEGWTNMENGHKDDIDWRVDQNGTPSSGTGPQVDYSPGNSFGNYLYLEASGTCSFQQGLLLSPCIDLTPASGAELIFAYHMSGQNMGSLRLDLLSEGEWHYNIIPEISGNQGSSWHEITVDLDTFTGAIIRLAFRAVTGEGYLSDIAIDWVDIQATCSMLVTSTLNSGPGTLRNVFACASPGDTIAFSPDLDTDTIVLEGSSIFLDKNIAITCPPGIEVTVSGEFIQKTFEIQPAASVYLQGFSIISGTSSTGRAISNRGNLVMKEMIVYDNPQQPGTGACIHNGGAIMISTSCAIY